MSIWTRIVGSFSKKGEPEGKVPPGYLVIIAIIGVLLLFGADFLVSSQTSSPPNPGPVPTRGETAETTLEDDFEAEYELSLARTLSAITGSGAVTVDVFLASSSRYEYARNLDTTEKNVQDQPTSGNGSKLTTENRNSSQVTLLRSGTQEQPLVVQTYAPAIQGVLVIAEGANDPRVKLELTKAVQIALGIPAHRVKVLSKEER